MATLSFSRTEAWSSGWRGKQSETDVRLDGEMVGKIRGSENAAFAGDMTYEVLEMGGKNKAQKTKLKLVESTGTLRDAKRIAVRHWTGASRA